MAVAIALCLAHDGPLFAQASANRVAWNRHVAPFRIAGSVYYVGAEGVSSFLIADPAGLVLLDGGFVETAPEIEKNVQALGFHLAAVKYLINSHAHYDHCGGLARLKRDLGARFAASDGDRAALESGRQPGFDKSQTAVPFPAVRVDRVLHDGDQITVGKTTLTAHVTAGHTPGCTTWTMQTSESGGNYQVVFSCSTSVADNNLVNNAKYPEIVQDYERTFAFFDRLPCDIFLAPHPFQFHMEEKRREQQHQAAPNPFVQPGELQAFNQTSEKQFKQELAAQRAAASSQ